MTYSYEQVSQAINTACDDILGETSEEKITDALNLLVNAALVYLTKPGATLLDAAAGYEVELDEDDDNGRGDNETDEEYLNRRKLDTILGWIA